ncbi:sugar phosphate isomerase/epimerase family protein [Yinghuangia sp. ASG 101]|uniref:sugar phosphate isomerase/epimerase family protein n=1 Tax=Yinghuangia sp. ASG 101 TaxID=2896848 RepID=UPI0022B241CA|nr:TIM barrel protein [Yinghuangia sp. ASG 101]
MTVPSPAAHVGLCSVTYRALSAEELVDLAAEAGLGVIEWGADVHVPPGDTEATRRARESTHTAGLATCSYGSYWCAGRDSSESFATVAATAQGLGARRVRVWAGTQGSATARDRASVARALREAGDIAAAHGLQVATEFHGGTLTDTAASTLRLLDEVGHGAVSTYWQPPLDEPDDVALAGLRDLRDRVAAVHVFSWSPLMDRLPLTGREALWRGALELLLPVDLLLEFVPGDDPAVLGQEAATLRSWLP